MMRRFRDWKPIAGWKLPGRRALPNFPVVLHVLVVCAASTHASLAQTTIPKWTATGDLTIDGARHELSTIMSVVVHPSGTIYVADRGDQRIRVFDRTGRLLSTLGRKGSGPGEFDHISRMGFVGDTLWAYDGGGDARLTTFDPRGKLIRTRRIDAIAPSRVGTMPTPKYPFVNVRGVNADGSIIAVALRAAGDPPAGYREQGIPLVHATLDGRLRSIIGWQARNEDWVQISRGGSSAGAGLPFQNPPVHAAAPGGGYYAEARAVLSGDSAGTVRVVVVRSRGDTAYVAQFRAAMRPIEARVIDSVLGARIAALEKGSALQRELIPLVRAAPRPVYHTPLRGLLLADDGSAVIVYAAGDSQLRDHLMLDRTGRPMGTFTLPRAVTAWQLRGDQLWGVSYDADDVPSIVRYRLAPAAR